MGWSWTPEQVNTKETPMKKVTTTVTGPACLTMRWVPVTKDGRTQMEMRWSAPAKVRRAPKVA